MPETMCGVLLLGHGGFEQLQYRTDLPIPQPSPGQVLIKVAAAGINNTDINTRIGWYDDSWPGASIAFPRIQGADCCGRIVAVGSGVSADRIGQRVIVRAMQDRHDAAAPFSFDTLGADLDGAFSEFMVTPSVHALEINCDWSGIELASLPCAYSTAEGMLMRSGVGAERVLVTGASGGVGSAAVQLAKRRNAEVIAVTSEAKMPEVKLLGADRVIAREQPISEVLDDNSIDVVLDVVGGPDWPSLIRALRPGGRYVGSGAIAGPEVALDLRALYLKDLTLYGSTFQPDAVFESLVQAVEANEIRANVAASYPLSDIVAAQQRFLAKQHVGKLVLEISGQPGS